MAYNEKKKAYNQAYTKENYKRIPLDVPIAMYEDIKNHAAAAGESVNGYIKQAVTDRIAWEDNNK